MAGQAAVAGETPFGRGVVQVDGVGVLEVELDQAKRAAGSRRLLQPAARQDAEAVGGQVAAALGIEFVPGDAGRDIPRRIEHDAVDARAQHRGLGARLAGDGAHRHRRLVAHEHGQHGGGDVHLDAVLRQRRGQPAPALHVGEDLVEATLDRDVELGAQAGGEDTGRLLAEAALGPLNGLGQLLIIDRNRRAADGRAGGNHGHRQRGGLVFLGQAGPQQFDHGADGARLEVHLGQRGEAAGRLDLAVLDKALLQRLVAGVGRRKAVQPGLHAVVGDGAREARRGIEGRGAQTPVTAEGGFGQPAGPHGLGVAQGGGDEGGVVGPARREGAGREAMQMGVVQGAAHLGRLISAGIDRAGRGRAAQRLSRRRAQRR